MTSITNVSRTAKSPFTTVGVMSGRDVDLGDLFDTTLFTSLKVKRTPTDNDWLGEATNSRTEACFARSVVKSSIATSINRSKTAHHKCVLVPPPNRALQGG
ncbi:hypothetical protein MRX96_007645 [Rhipicephalus microplus]